MSSTDFSRLPRRLLVDVAEGRRRDGRLGDTLDEMAATARRELQRRLDAEQEADEGRLGLNAEQTRNAAGLMLLLFVVIVTGGRRRDEDR